MIQGVSDILQSPSLDLCSAVDLVQAIVQSFQAHRDDSDFEGLQEISIQEILYTAEKCDVEVEPTSKRKTKQSQSLDGHAVMPSTGERSEQGMETFRASIFYPSLDNMLSELNTPVKQYILPRAKQICQAIHFAKRKLYLHLLLFMNATQMTSNMS